MPADYDAVLIVSFGGPEGPDEVLPFLENVLRGKPVPRKRMLEVAEHYHRFGGVSPIAAQNRALLAALAAELDTQGPKLPVYLGNRNWHPLLADTLRKMTADGVRRALAFFTSAYSSYSGCRQYLEDIERARAEVGAGAPEVDKLRAYFNHPGFVLPMIDSLVAAIESLPEKRRPAAQVLFTAHSIPQSMAVGCRYEVQLRETARLVAEGAGCTRWRLVFQSRSGAPNQPWLEPDVCDALREIAARGDTEDVVIVPSGFISDHLEVLYDLDIEARATAAELGLNFLRVPTVGTDGRFVTMIRQLITERISGSPSRPTLGRLGPVPEVCSGDCCPRNAETKTRR